MGINKPHSLRVWAICVFALICSLGNSFAQQTYTVLPGDTFSRIARQNGLTLTQLREANPHHKEDLSPGDYLLIPAKKILPDVSGETSWGLEDSLFHHHVISGETLYGVARQYGISEGDLQAVNPGLGQELPIGMSLRIPGMLAESQTDVLNGIRESLLSQSRQDEPFTSFVQPAILEVDTVRVLAMLPFLLPTDTIEGGGFDARTTRLREIALSCIHGLEWGAQMAKDSGMHVQLHVVDTEPDTMGVVMWSQGDLDWADVVFGPLRRSPLDSVATLLAADSTPQWILTGQPDQFWTRHAHTVVAESRAEEGMRALGRLVSNNHPNDTVFMLETKGQDASLERAFRSGFVAHRASEKGLISLPATSRFAEGLTAQMDTSKMNVVVIPAGSSARSMMAYVQTELQLADSFPVRLYAHPKSLDYDFLEWDFVNRTQWTIPSNAWLNWNDSLIAKQVSSFRDSFGTDPDTYAIQCCDALNETLHWIDPAPAALPVLMNKRFNWIWDESANKCRNTAWRIIALEQGTWNEVSISN